MGRGAEGPLRARLRVPVPAGVSGMGPPGSVLPPCWTWFALVLASVSQRRDPREKVGVLAPLGVVNQGD